METITDSNTIRNICKEFFPRMQKITKIEFNEQTIRFHFRVANSTEYSELPMETKVFNKLKK